MRVYTYTNQHLGNMIDSLSLDPSTISDFKRHILEDYTSLSDYIYEVLTECVEDYEPLTVARDYTGEYDTAYEIFGKLNSAVLPDLKSLDIRVLSLPLHHNQSDRMTTIDEKNLELDYPFSKENRPYEFAEITDQLISAIEAFYINDEGQQTTKHLLFTRHHTGLCIFVH